MRNSMIATAALLTLAALPATAQPADAYVARGTEPFWSLRIDARTMKFEAPGRAPVSVPAPKVIHGFAGEMWQTRRINVNTVHGRCSDGMSDNVYRDTVTVTVDGRSYKGCGGGYATATPRPTSAIEGDWRIEAVGGRPLVRGTTPDVSFTGDRITGNSGCNRFNGSYRFTGTRLSAGPLASTRRACLDRATGAQERLILGVLGQNPSVSNTRNGKLVLTNRRGERLVLARPSRR